MFRIKASSNRFLNMSSCTYTRLLQQRRQTSALVAAVTTTGSCPLVVTNVGSVKASIVVLPRRWKSTNNNNNKTESSSTDVMAERMHEELSTIMKKTKKPSPSTPTTTSGISFGQFMKANKTPFVNIGVSFMLVLLAYQIVALRRSGRVRQEQLDKTAQDLLTTKEILRTLTSDDFVTKMTTDCAAMVLLEEDAVANKNDKKWNVFGRTERRQQLSAEELAEKLHPVIDLLLNEQIGDAGLTDEQKKAQTVEALRNAQVSSQREIDVVDEVKEEEVIDIVQDSNGKNVVQRRVFSM